MDIEPGAEEAGEMFTTEMENAIPDIILTLQQLSTDKEELIKFKPLYGDALIEI